MKCDHLFNKINVRLKKMKYIRRKIYKLEKVAVEIIQNEAVRKRMKKMNSISMIWKKVYAAMQPNIWVAGVSKVVWEVIMVKSHPKSSNNLMYKEHEKKKVILNQTAIIE